MILFLDTNVIIDAMLKREGLWEAPAEVLTRIGRGDVHGVISSHSVVTIYYLVKRFKDDATARRAVRILLNDFSVAECSFFELEKALATSFSDYEDAVQYLCALESKCDIIVSRNVKDFSSALIRVVTAETFVEHFL